MKNIGIIGGGAWGTALGLAALRNNTKKNVTLWAYEKEIAEQINTKHQNPFLVDIDLNPNLKATNDLATIVQSDFIFIVSPSSFVRDFFEQLKNLNLNEKIPIIICSKGIEEDSLKFMSEVAEEVLPNPILVLSGPSFAIEVAKDLPTHVSLASENKGLAKEVEKIIVSKNFNIKINQDLIGTEIGGSIKNVIAIACGFYEGKNRGKNAQGYLLTEGLREIKTLTVAKGGKEETAYELCGVGDLILTCNSKNSRNMSLGFELGQGKTLKQVMQTRKTVAEGVNACKNIIKLSKKLEINLPICEMVFDLLEK